MPDRPLAKATVPSSATAGRSGFQPSPSEDHPVEDELGQPGRCGGRSTSCGARAADEGLGDAVDLGRERAPGAGEEQGNHGLHRGTAMNSPRAMPDANLPEWAPELARRLGAELSADVRVVAVEALHGGACQDNLRADVMVDGAPRRLAHDFDAKASPLPLRHLAGGLRCTSPATWQGPAGSAF